MKLLGAAVAAITLLALPLSPAAALPEAEVSSNVLATGVNQNSQGAFSQRDTRSQRPPVIVRSLTDYPGRVTAVTEVQKAQIRKVLSELDGNTKFICTGARLEGQPLRMNRAVRLRAKLVCEYAQSLRPDLSYWYQTKLTEHRSFNGRVIVVSK